MGLLKLLFMYRCFCKIVSMLEFYGTFSEGLTRLSSLLQIQSVEGTFLGMSTTFYLNVYLLFSFECFLNLEFLIVSSSCLFQRDGIFKYIL